MTDTITTPAPDLAPGQATSRYLRAVQDRRPGPIDWRAAPATYQRYPTAGRVILPWAPAPGPKPADSQLALLGTLLRHLLGLRTNWAHPTTGSGSSTRTAPSVMVNRPAPSGGARYPIEAYLATAAGPGRDAALHHYDAAHHCLDLVRTGDHRAALAGLLSTSPPAPPDVVLILTAVFWRNGFKYGEFAYRLHCQETGVLTAHALALAEALELTPAVHVSFTDHDVQSLLGLDPSREGPLAILTFTGPAPQTDAHPHYPSISDLIARPATQPANPPPGVTRSLPHLTALHTAASRNPHNPGEPGIPAPAAAQPHQDRLVRLPHAHRACLAEGIPARASAPAGYRPIELELDLLATVLAAAASGYPGDLAGTPRAPVSVTLYALVQRVTGITPGAYRYQPDSHILIPVGDTGALDAVTRGPLQPNTRHALPEAAAILLPVGDPLAGVHQLGDRWYRIQQIETGLMAHHATLAATAHGLAARIHSDGTNQVTDTALGLHTSSPRSLSFLLIGHPRPGPTLLAAPSIPTPHHPDLSPTTCHAARCP